MESWQPASMSDLIPTKYDPREIESRWYRIWETEGYFRPASDRQGKHLKDSRYVIVIPPPNVTGILHMGHALNNSIQDILVRWQRMRGRDTLWVPGVDHAGIATQNVVERKLAKEKKTRNDLGREKFLEEVWRWKEEHGHTITRQLRRLGASCDWSRERFTMDEGLSQAVREAFVTLYERGLIYQGDYIINWCPRCQTALSDEESVHKETQGGLYHIKYPIAGSGDKAEKVGEDHIVVATTRPETMLGDTAVAIHPEDGRYRHLLRQKVVLPLMKRPIPILADDFVDPEFGTGIVKVTPAHDPNDFEMGNRHGLARINVMTPDGKINEHGGAYRGLDRFQARKKIVEDLEKEGLFVRRDSHVHAVGHCYRCDTVVEPYLSKQWFVKMKPLAEKALAAHKKGKTIFYPDRWTKVYTHWLENIRDWCISRQIWWGHQIPVWYCEACSARGPWENVIVARSDPQKCPKCGSKQLKQDPDVLDTWFSSWLWPLSTLGWPEETEDLKYFYPTSDLVTAPEIIFFWVARMIMAGLEFKGEVPFNRIYIHGTVRAQSGLKMSKSLGNVIDPIEVIDEIGADALRFSMIMLSSQDVYLSREKFDVGRNFTNKLWNASRFVLMNLEGFKQGSAGANFQVGEIPVAGRWILSKLGESVREIEKNISDFSVAQAANTLYHFVWNDFCDWFIELAKPALSGDSEKEKKMTEQILFFALEKILRLLHPFIPFVTEEIWQKMRTFAYDAKDWPPTLMQAAWPSAKHFTKDMAAERYFRWLQESVGGIRHLRAQLNIHPSQLLNAVVLAHGEEAERVFNAYRDSVEKLGRVKLTVDSGFKKSKAFLGSAFADFEVFINIEGVVNPEEEFKRIEKKVQESTQRIVAIKKKLFDENFVTHAPKDVIDKERDKLADAQQILKSQEELLALFK